MRKGGDSEDPKLKLGENEKGRLQPAREKTNCKGCHDNEQRSAARTLVTRAEEQTLKALGLCDINPYRVESMAVAIFPGLSLMLQPWAGISQRLRRSTASVLLQKGVAPNQANCFRT